MTDQKQKRKEKIFEAALQCFNETGFDKTNSETIAARAHMLIPLKVSTCYAPKFPPVPVQSFHLIQSNVSTDRRSEATV